MTTTTTNDHDDDDDDEDADDGGRQCFAAQARAAEFEMRGSKEWLEQSVTKCKTFVKRQID